jgi:predicted ribosome quality control (RQC) complex YloA/Tae2 family protein
MSNVHAVQAGATEVTVTDWDTSAEVTIPLGDGRTPVPDVAAKLYKEARRLRRGAEAVAPLLEAARADVAVVEAAAARLDGLPALGEEGEAALAPAALDARNAVLQEVRQALEAKGWLPPWREAGLEARGAALAKRAAKRTGGGGGGGSSGDSPLPTSPFRRFTSPSGLTVLVGRNNRDNDRLSMRVANPGDTWLHARGVPGAHVVLRAPPGGAEGASLPDEADLRFAASIAAFYSKARDGSVVDVSHTPARHVKKPRGAPPGLVTLLQEAVVRVRPDDAAAVAAAAEGGEEDE